MVVQDGMFSLEVVDAQSRCKCREQPEHPSMSTTLVEVDPHAHYYLRLQVGNNDMSCDPNRAFLFYIHINDTYIGYRQCLSAQRGSVDVGLHSFSEGGIITGTQEPIRFEEVTLLEIGNNNNMHMMMMPDDKIQNKTYHPDVLQVGTITVKIYEAMMDHRSTFGFSAFGNNVTGEEAYQPGQFRGAIQVRCCCSAEAGRSLLRPDEVETFQRLFMKRSNDRANHPTHYSGDDNLQNNLNYSNDTNAMMANPYQQEQPYAKRMRTSTGAAAMSMMMEAPPPQQQPPFSLA